jgi:tRNA pseudouridine55 synthase
MNTIHGILLLDKPIEMTSNAALQKAKRLFGSKKAGHTGSLDPLATGMLPLCFGEATKFSQYLLESDKYYRVTAQLGMKTTTGDAEGEVIENLPVPVLTYPLFTELFQKLLGEVQQIPPMYSAIKQQGRPLYELARKGIIVERKPRTVHIYNLCLIEFQPNQVTFEVHCSKGTYIRTLVEDIGDKIGCGAYVSHLRRLAVAPYEQHKMYTLNDLTQTLEQQGPESLKQFLLPVETALQKIPEIKLMPDSVYYFRMGQPVRVSQSPREGLVKIFTKDGKFMGLGEILDGGMITPKRLVNVLM